ncbi:regulator of G-protein signaling 18 isoform X3 [Ambystoma mexicanum]|uniref:regulator of G-protein signaling 18 isoform X3 n=1 Tax=Ambystoma mexicanum TaxID=8296 RepID=UPI0037E80425
MFKRYKLTRVNMLTRKLNWHRLKSKLNQKSLVLRKSGSHENINYEKADSMALGISASLDEVASWGESFEKLLSHKDGVEAFTRFLKTEFSEENIEFWLACEEYKESKTTQQLSSTAKTIFEKFIQKEAPKEVNLDFNTKQLTSKNILQPTLFSFDSAQATIYRLMEKDSYPRFLKSDIYLHLMRGSPAGWSTPRRRSRSFTYNDFQDVKSEFAIWL